jgi:hypothetical protein
MVEEGDVEYEWLLGLDKEYYGGRYLSTVPAYLARSLVRSPEKIFIPYPNSFLLLFLSISYSRLFLFKLSLITELYHEKKFSEQIF